MPLRAVWVGGLATALALAHWDARPAAEPAADVIAAARCSASGGTLPLAAAALMPGIGPYRAARVSANDEAQRFFEQGMVMGWGFNVAESERSFRAAIERDPSCAMCHWGLAWSLGPGLNNDMVAANRPVALAALAQARRHAGDARTLALITAQELRFSGGASEAGRSAVYARSMRHLAQSRPDDADLALLAAEAAMVADPYDWWRDNGQPKPRTNEIAALLRQTLTLSPDHPGALHYTIHLYEDSPTPERALQAAQRLPASAPGLGHLVHMPSHIDLRLGRYHEAVLANQSALEVDREYAMAAFRQGGGSTYLEHYPYHNLNFLWVASLWSGESATARDAAERLAERFGPDSVLNADAVLAAAPWITDVRFRAWERTLARSVPFETDSYTAAFAHFARGLAFAARGDVVAGQVELAALQRAEKAVRRKVRPRDAANEAADMLRVASWQLSAELAAAQGQSAAAIALARRAVAAEDRLPFAEPARWQVSSRHLLGRLLLVDGRAAAAASVYAADLKRHPDNAVALAGLARAERLRGDKASADRLGERARLAWVHADGPIPAP